MRLYAALRRGNPVAAWKFLELAARELGSWLDRRFPRNRRRLDTPEIAREAVEEVILRVDAIPSWPAAWAYACRVAVRRARRRERSWEREKRAGSLERSRVDIIDRDSDGFQTQIELEEVIQETVDRLSPRDRNFLSAMARCTGDLKELAKALNLSVSTVIRWRRALRHKFLRALRDEE